MNDINLKIELIYVDELTTAPNNSKMHTKEQIKHIANSIEKFGFNDPIAVSGSDNIVLEGNGRVEAAKSLGIKKLPCVRLDHMNEDEQRAYVIAHNSLCLETGFDDAVLFKELQELQKIDFADFGVDTEKYIQTIDKLQRKELQPIQKAHYLISVDVNYNDKIINLIDKIKTAQGVDVFATCN